MLKMSTGALDNAYQRGVPARIRANGAGGFSVNAPQIVAKPDFFPREKNGLGQLFHDGGIRLNQMQGHAFGGARPDPGQLAQRGDEGGDGIGKHGMRMQ